MTTDGWDALRRGLDCPLCAPRAASNEHWDVVAELSSSSLYLAKNQTYRGHCQLVFDRRHVARPDQLSFDEWVACCDDLFRAQAAIMAVVKADHLNVESLGNVVPHLHWHIVPRYRNDPRWGAPIWLTSLADMIDTRLPDADRRQLIADLRVSLDRTKVPRRAAQA